MNQGLVVSFSNKGGSIADGYWLRLELVDTSNETMTVGEAAEVIDALYNINICDSTSSPTSPISPTSPTITSKNRLDGTDWDRALNHIKSLPYCNDKNSAASGDKGGYNVDVKVWRSDPSELYKLQLTNGYAGAARRVYADVDETLTIENSISVVLDKPIIGGLRAAWTDINGPEIKIKGTTLYWEGGKVSGALRVAYNTTYDLVTCRVTGEASDTSIVEGSSSSEWLGTGWYSGSEDASELTNLQNIECTLLAFYHYQYEIITLSRPEQDDNTSEDWQNAVCIAHEIVHVKGSPGLGDERYSEDDLRNDCERSYGKGTPEAEQCIKDRTRQCYKRVKYKQICTCGGGDGGTNTVEIPVNCPPGYNSGSNITKNWVEDGGTNYIDCGGDDVENPEYYEDKCCHSWPFDELMPHCKELHEPYTGKPPDEHLISQLKGQYGDNVNIISVGPAESYCGETITTQDVGNKSCCDGVPALNWNKKDSSELVSPGGKATAVFVGGKTPISYSVSGGVFANGATTIILDSRSVTFTADADSCGIMHVNAVGTCGHMATCNIKNTNGHWRSHIVSSEDKYNPMKGDVVIQQTTTYDCRHTTSSIKFVGMEYKYYTQIYIAAWFPSCQEGIDYVNSVGGTYYDSRMFTFMDSANDNECVYALATRGNSTHSEMVGPYCGYDDRLGAGYFVFGQSQHTEFHWECL